MCVGNDLMFFSQIVRDCGDIHNRKPETQKACYVPYQRLVGVAELWYRAPGVSELAFAMGAKCSVVQHGLIFV